MKSATGLIIVLLPIFLISNSALSYQVLVTPRTATSIEYTDNIFLSDENKHDEFMTIVSVGFTLELLEKTNGLQFSYDPSYVFYDEYDENNTLRHDAQLFAWLDLGKNTRLDITNRFLFSEDPLGEGDLIRDDQVVIPGDTTIRRTRNEYYTNTAILRLNHQFGADNKVYAGILHSFLRNDDPGTQDNDRYQPMVGLTYWLGTKYGIETKGTYTKGKFSGNRDYRGTSTDDFDDWFGSLKLIRNMTKHFSAYAQYDHICRNFEDENDNDYKLYVPSVGLEYLAGKDFRIKMGLGYFYQDIDDDDNEKGYFGSGEVRKTWNFRRSDIRLTGSAGLQQNEFGAQRLGLERFVSLETIAQYFFTRKFMGDIGGRFHYSDPVDSNVAEGIENQKRFAGSIGLTYVPLRWMALKFGYQHSRYDSDIKKDTTSIVIRDDGYRENRLMFMIILQADPPWRL